LFGFQSHDQSVDLLINIIRQIWPLEQIEFRSHEKVEFWSHEIRPHNHFPFWRSVLKQLTKKYQSSKTEQQKNLLTKYSNRLFQFWNKTTTTTKQQQQNNKQWNIKVIIQKLQQQTVLQISIYFIKCKTKRGL
jgi:hypothetical protein